MQHATKDLWSSPSLSEMVGFWNDCAAGRLKYPCRCRKARSKELCGDAAAWGNTQPFDCIFQEEKRSLVSEKGEVLLRGVGTLRHLFHQKHLCCGSLTFENPHQKVVPRSRIPRSTSHFSFGCACACARARVGGRGGRWIVAPASVWESIYIHVYVNVYIRMYIYIYITHNNTYYYYYYYYYCHYHYLSLLLCVVVRMPGPALLRGPLPWNPSAETAPRPLIRCSES